MFSHFYFVFLISIVLVTLVILGVNYPYLVEVSQYLHFCYYIEVSSKHLTSEPDGLQLTQLSKSTLVMKSHTEGFTTDKRMRIKRPDLHLPS